MEELRYPLEGDCKGKFWSNKRCFFGVRLSEWSEGTGRFWEERKEEILQTLQMENSNSVDRQLNWLLQTAVTEAPPASP